MSDSVTASPQVYPKIVWLNGSFIPGSRAASKPCGPKGAAFFFCGITSTGSLDPSMSCECP